MFTEPALLQALLFIYVVNGIFTFFVRTQFNGSRAKLGLLHNFVCSVLWPFFTVRFLVVLWKDRYL